jgi:hypothetical protein
MYGLMRAHFAAIRLAPDVAAAGKDLKRFLSDDQVGNEKIGQAIERLWDDFRA